MRYGLPYKGSKSRIVNWLIGSIPSADVFVDLFCGGCAATHAAPFTCVAETEIQCTFSRTANKRRTERLFFNGTLEEYHKIIGR